MDLFTTLQIAGLIALGTFLPLAAKWVESRLSVR